VNNTLTNTAHRPVLCKAQPPDGEEEGVVSAMNGSSRLTNSFLTSDEIQNGILSSSSTSELRGHPSTHLPSGRLRSHQKGNGWMSSLPLPSSDLRGRAFSVFTPMMVTTSTHESTSRSMDSAVHRRSPSYTPDYSIATTNWLSDARKRRPFPSPDLEALKCIVSSGIVFEDGTSRIASLERWSPAWSAVRFKR